MTASGPLLVLTSHESLHDRKLLEALKGRGIGKFVSGSFSFFVSTNWGRQFCRNTLEVAFFLGDLLPRRA
jgi:hypothetical protein